MADVDDGDILRLGAVFDFDAIYDVVNVWHVLTEATAGRTWAQATTAIQSWLDSVYASLKTPLSDEMTTGEVSVANVTQGTTLGTIAWSPTWSGAGAGDQTAAGVCCFTWARTYTPRVQIRKYFGVFPETNIADGSWATAARTGCEGAMTYAIAPHAAAAFTNFQAVAYNRTAGTYTLAVSVASSAEPAYQRRRRRGRGS